MPPRRPEQNTSTTLPRRQLGRALRDARQKLGQTLEQAADTMGQVGRSTLNRLELGEIEKPKPYLIEFICKYYGLPDDDIEYLKALATQANTKSWWQSSRDLLRKGFVTYLGLESAAEQLYVFQSLILPGLLQSADYAKATASGPFSTPDSEAAIDQLVAFRTQRASILTRKHKPVKGEFVISESVLHTVVGSSRIMRGALRHVADLSLRDNITVRILPGTAGFPAGDPVVPHIILDFPRGPRGITEPSVVYTETMVGSMFFEDKGDLELFRKIHEFVRNASYEENESRDLLRQVAARRYEQ